MGKNLQYRTDSLENFHLDSVITKMSKLPLIMGRRASNLLESIFSCPIINGLTLAIFILFSIFSGGESTSSAIKETYKVSEVQFTKLFLSCR